MSLTTKCHCNATMDSFPTEDLRYRFEARPMIHDCIDVSHNPHCPHSSLRFQSPIAFKHFTARHPH